MRIQDGTGGGYEVAISDENRMQMDSVNSERQNHVSSKHNKAFQVSTAVNIAAAKTNLMLITNDSENDLTITYIRLMSIGAAAANSAAYFTIEGGGEYTSGGDELTPTNMNIGQSTLSESTIYSGTTAIVDDGNYVEFDRNYEANSMQSYNKAGSLILKRGASMLITHTGSTAAGVAYCRVSYYFGEKLNGH